MMLRIPTQDLDLDGSVIKRVIVVHLFPSRARRERFFLTYRSSVS